MSDILKLFRSAGASDLEAVNARIAELQSELEGLRIIQKALSVRVNGKPERAPPGNKGELATKIYDIIAKNGPGTSKQIALKLGSTPKAVGVAAQRSGWFRKNDEGKLEIATT